MDLYIGLDIPQQHHHAIARMVSAWSCSQDETVKGALLGKTLEQVLSQISAGLAITLIEGTTVVGYCTLYRLAHDAWELGTVIVNPDYRGRHLARRLYEGVQVLHRRLGGCIWETTHAMPVVHLSEVAGFGTPSYDAVPDHVYNWLCREASCFRPDPLRPGRCTDEHNAGGSCMLCHRSAACLSMRPSVHATDPPALTAGQHAAALTPAK